jgi:hypothetical protein
MLKKICNFSFFSIFSLFFSCSPPDNSSAIAGLGMGKPKVSESIDSVGFSGSSNIASSTIDTVSSSPYIKPRAKTESSTELKTLAIMFYPVTLKVETGDSLYLTKNNHKVGYILLEIYQTDLKDSVIFVDSKHNRYLLKTERSINGAVTKLTINNKVFFRNPPTTVKQVPKNTTIGSSQKGVVTPSTAKSKFETYPKPDKKTAWGAYISNDVKCECAQWGPAPTKEVGTFYKISKLTCISVDALMKANPNGLRLGEKVCLKLK